MLSMDIKKPIPETFADLKRLNYTWYVVSEFNPADSIKSFGNIVPEDER